MKLSIILAGLALSAQAQATISGSYLSLTKIDAAITEMAEGKMAGLTRKQPSDVTINRIEMNGKKAGKEMITVDIGYVVCNVNITTIAPPAGRAAPPQVKAAVSGCSSYRTIAPVAVMKYEQVRPALEAAAKKNRLDLSVAVSGPVQAPILTLTGKK